MSPFACEYALICVIGRHPATHAAWRASVLSRQLSNEAMVPDASHTPLQLARNVSSHMLPEISARVGRCTSNCRCACLTEQCQSDQSVLLGGWRRACRDGVYQAA